MVLPLWVWVAIFIASLVLLVKSADWFTDAAERIGLYLGLPAFLVGVTIVSIGTSLPELASSVVAVLRGSSEIVAGNVIGSNIANILLVLGLTALVAKKLTTSWELVHVDLPILIGSVFLLTISILNSRFSISEALFCLVGYVIYIWYVLAMQKQHKSKLKARRPKKLGWRSPIALVISAGLIYLGAKYTIDSVIHLSQFLNIGTEIIAVTAVALGTSLPELTVSVRAALRGKSEIAIGNILGSNIVNVFLVMGVAGLFGTLAITQNILTFAIPALIAATLLYFFITQDKEVTKWEGAMLILLYVVFVVKMFGIA